MHLILDVIDLKTILIGILEANEQRSAIHDIHLSVKNKRLYLTAEDIIWDVVLDGMSWMQRNAAKLLLPTSVSLSLTAINCGPHSLTITWIIDDTLLGSIQRLPIGVNVGQRLIERLFGKAASQVGNDTFILGIDSLGGAMPGLCNTWHIVEAVAPSGDDAFHLVVMPT